MHRKATWTHLRPGGIPLGWSWDLCSLDTCNTRGPPDAHHSRVATMSFGCHGKRWNVALVRSRGDVSSGSFAGLYGSTLPVGQNERPLSTAVKWSKLFLGWNKQIFYVCRCEVLWIHSTWRNKQVSSAEVLWIHSTWRNKQVFFSWSTVNPLYLKEQTNSISWGTLNPLYLKE
jgi:hypothetical protein